MTDHKLILSPTHYRDATAWRGACSCGTWTEGPHFTDLVIEAYWRDHVYLAGIDATDAHVRALLAEAAAARG